MCTRLDEDCGHHLFFKCKMARECWRFMQLEVEETRCNLVQCSSGKEVAQKLWAMQPDQKLEIIVWMWIWWMARNKANAGERVQCVVECLVNEHAKLKCSGNP